MTPEKPKRNIIARIIIRAAKIPSLYLIFGVLLIALSYIDDVFPLTQWKYMFDLTDKIGEIFLALAIVTFIYKLFVLTCRRWEKNLHDKHKIASLILSSLRKGLRIIFVLVALNIIIDIISPTRHYLYIANHVINVVMIASVGWITLQILYTIEAVLYQYMIALSRDEHFRVKALYTKLHILRNIATVVIAVITMAAILMSFSSFRNIGISLLASAGFLTAIIGLAAQKTLFSLFSGLQIAMSHPIKIGDIVVVGKESGIIEEITFTYVTLRLGDRRRLMVPITYFTETPFENWSHEGHSLRSSLHFFVDFMMPIEPLRQELDKILSHSNFWDGQAKKLQIANLTEHAAEIRIQISADSADNLSDLRAEVRERMLEFIRNNYPDYFPRVREMNVRQHSSAS